MIFSLFPHRSASSAILCGLLLICSHDPAAATDEPRSATPDTAAVINNVLNAWHRADAHGIALQYEPDGDFVSPSGDHAVGRAAIEAFYANAFVAGYAGTGATATVVHTRSLSPGLVLIDGTWAINPTPSSKVRASESGLFVSVLRRHHNRWSIVALREQTSARSWREL